MKKIRRPVVSRKRKRRRTWQKILADKMASPDYPIKAAATSIPIDEDMKAWLKERGYL